MIPYLVVKNPVGRRRLHGRMDFRGLSISVENAKSSSRQWYNPDDGSNGITRMNHPYGYFQGGTLGVDGDAVDVYVGPDKDSDTVFIVHQMKVPDFVDYDEDKVMLGFATEEAAREAYLKHYDNPRFLGSITAMPFDKFKEKLASHKGKMIKSLRKGGEEYCKRIGDELGVDWGKVDLDEFCDGMFDEEEHKHVIDKDNVPDSKQIAQIVLDHLKEDPKYYSKLKRAGLAKSFPPFLRVKGDRCPWLR